MGETIQKSRVSPTWLGVAIGLALLVALIGGQIALHSGDNKVVIGSHDEVYYYRRASKQDALGLGNALKSTGFFNDRGTDVLLWMGGSEPTTISFIVNDGAWNRPNAISNFTEIGRRVAHSVGGFPIRLNLVDAGRVIRRKMVVGKALLGGGDAVYYFGSATEADARELGQALQSAGYFTGAGATVALLKGEGTVFSFVVQQGLWDQPAVIATLDRLVRQVAASAGGLPIELRLLDRDMDIKKEVEVR